MLCDVTFRCGHTQLVNLIGQNEDRQRKLLRYRNFVICPDCQASRMVTHGRPSVSIWSEADRIRPSC